MYSDIYKVSQLGKGFLAVMAKPVGGEWIEDEFRGIAQFGICRLVSLLENHEIRELGLQAAPALCAANQVDFLHFPIKDRGVPSSLSATKKLVTHLHSSIVNGDNTVIHCHAGIGRTGLLAAAILIRHGEDVAEALSMVSKARRVPVPDTEEQINWLKQHQAALRI
ncbi:protein-tyrosine phosphatase family protein [Undibacterium sp. Ji49W]|uniref:protein-tyrosine phosphatase family protein n=1 Tax=Undibacterium sp. Ji49W TaxID=3413040 RepID=UPI003BF03474